MINKKQRDKQQIDFISEVLKYSNVIFHKGTELQRTEVLDLLFYIAEETNVNPNENSSYKIISFPYVNKD